MSGKRQLESSRSLELLVKMTHLMIICFGLRHWSVLTLKFVTKELRQTTLIMFVITGSYFMSAVRLSSDRPRYLYQGSVKSLFCFVMHFISVSILMVAVSSIAE